MSCVYIRNKLQVKHALGSKKNIDKGLKSKPCCCYCCWRSSGSSSEDFERWFLILSFQSRKVDISGVGRDSGVSGFTLCGVVWEHSGQWSESEKMSGSSCRSSSEDDVSASEVS